MGSERPFWDEQLQGLLRGYRDPELAADRLEALGRRLAEQLREDAVLEANLRTLLPRSEDPEVEAERLEAIGERLAGQLGAPRVSRRRRRHRERPNASIPWAWAGTAAAAALLIALATLTRGPASPPPPRPSLPVVRTEPEPPYQPTPAPPRDPVPPRPTPPPLPSSEAPPRSAAPPREQPPAAVPPPAPAPAPAPVAPTLVEPPPAAVAVLEGVEGDVQPPQSGRGLAPGDRVVTGKEGRARIRYEDGTRLELAGESVLELGAGPGKRLRLDRGVLAAHVRLQAPGTPMMVATPGAEAWVVGTEFRLAITGTATRLEVTEGKVRLTRRPDGASVDVSEGHFAVASRGVALLTRPIPDERRTLFLEVEQLGSARGTRPADGPGRRIFLEPFAAAQGGWCVAVPGAGMEVVGDLRLAKGTWHLWIRVRDEPGAVRIGFTAAVNGQALGEATTPGAGRSWMWKKFTFAWPGGAARLALRSTFEGVKAAPAQADFRQSPYAALNRWDRICLTPDESFTPE